MSPLFMSLMLLAGWGIFIWSAKRRWVLMNIGPAEPRWDQPGRRLALTLKFAIGQARMPRYGWSGVAHILVFSGFLVLLLRSLILWGRGYDASFNLFIFGPEQPLGMLYAIFKDTFALLVITGVLIFAYYRGIKKLPRLTHTTEGMIILVIIFTMMVSDILYDAAHMVRSGAYHRIEYAGYLLSGLLKQAPDGGLAILEQLGFWMHSGLVLLFLNLLPYSKHFHIITALPNVFFQNLQPVGRLTPIHDMEGRIEREEPLGTSQIDHLHWKHLLDLYTCTECGRCSDMCPANRTGKLLSPKHLTIHLRDHLYSHQKEVLQLDSSTGGDTKTPSRLSAAPLVSNELIKPEVLWACTSCRACEQECPVFITYVDKIVDMRRHLVMERSEFPEQLQNAFRGLESSGNPWSYPPDSRLEWAEGLNVSSAAEKPDFDILYWVGCAPAFDARAKQTAAAFAKLLNHAGINFAVLGREETCTGDAARRAGNEFLFQMLAQQNVETLNRYQVKKIVTTCPHCFNTLKNEYPDFGGKYEVVHHTDLLADLVQHGKIKPTQSIEQNITYHDSCYLGRYNEVYDAPREILRAIPGVQLVEPELTRDRGMCCGAGGAQMFKEEEHGQLRVNQERTRQLLKVLDEAPQRGGCAVATACPFCMTMLSDGLNDRERSEVQQLDVVQLLAKSTGL
ncbi:MAG: putative iron-sulfur-binding oxidoreductase FadF [Phycisphaerae bacterium]|nr:putative iron-sulfur-binding oxidoreductase FadF [Phycisphaerae bacterium]